jgi:hypothetical protein
VKFSILTKTTRIISFFVRHTRYPLSQFDAPIAIAATPITKPKNVSPGLSPDTENVAERQAMPVPNNTLAKTPLGFILAPSVAIAKI